MSAAVLRINAEAEASSASLAASEDFSDMPLRMSPKTLAASLPNTSEKTLERWRSVGGGPLYSKCEGKVYYLKSNVVAWILGNLQESTTSKKPVAVTTGQNINA